MRDQRVRIVFLALIFILPWVISSEWVGGFGGAGSVSARSPGSISPSSISPEGGPALSSIPFDPAKTACWIDAVLILGLMYAARQRRRLLSRRGIWEPDCFSFRGGLRRA